MINIQDLTEDDKGRKVRYSTPGGTILDGALHSWDAELLYVGFSGGSHAVVVNGIPGRQEVKMRAQTPVPTDPASVEFV